MSRCSTDKIGKSGEQKNMSGMKKSYKQSQIISKYSMCLGNNIYIDVHRAVFLKICFKEYQSCKRSHEKKMGGW